MTREDREVDCALRLAVRGEVAGATPRRDAWLRLQRRIAADAPPQPVVLGFDRPVMMSPWSPRSPWTLGLLSRFSQAGAALLTLALLLGQPAQLQTWLGAAHAVPVAHTVEVRPAVADGPARDQLLQVHEAQLRASFARTPMPFDGAADPLPPASAGPALAVDTAAGAADLDEPADLAKAQAAESARARQQFDPDVLSPFLLRLDPQ